MEGAAEGFATLMHRRTTVHHPSDAFGRSAPRRDACPASNGEFLDVGRWPEATLLGHSLFGGADHL